MASPIAQRLAEIAERFGVAPCGDASCIFGSGGGMHTNGGCQCVADVRDPSARQKLFRMHAIARVAVEQLIEAESRRG